MPLDLAGMVPALVGVLAGVGSMFLLIARNTHRKAESPHD